MHLGNIFAALMSWLAARHDNGRWILRIEDLDSQRSRREYASLIEDDLRWLSLDWDEGGLDDLGPSAPYSQSHRHDIYARALATLSSLTYPCHCRRADILSTGAPHRSDGRVIYAGTCRPAKLPAPPDPTPHSTRIIVPDIDVKFVDRIYGPQSVNLARECGDFILRRADGAWSYQLAVVTDDALMGVTQVVRGSDLLLSAAQQIYLHTLLGFPPPEYAHIPLLVNPSDGRRLSKRDASLSMEALRQRHSPQHIIGYLAYLAHLQDSPAPATPRQLLQRFNWELIPRTLTIPANPEAILRK